MQTLLGSKADLGWLAKVHGIRGATRYKVVVLYGNEDAPDRVELFAKDDYRCVPVVYVADETGTLRKEET